jgi:hypothetical protein
MGPNLISAVFNCLVIQTVDWTLLQSSQPDPRHFEFFAYRDAQLQTKASSTWEGFRLLKNWILMAV